MDSRRVETQDELIDAIATIAGAASRQLMFFLPDPANDLWSQPALLDILRGFVTSRSHRETRWLLGAVEGLARDHGALIALAQRLPSLVVLRELDADFSAPATQAFVTNDRGQLLWFDSSARLAGTYTEASERARPLAARFDEAWARARALPELRALGI